MAEVVFFHHRRVAKLLQSGAVRIIVATQAGPVPLNVGGLASKNEKLEPHQLSGDFMFQGQPRHMEIPWGAVLLSTPLAPPSGGGDSPPMQAQRAA
jgi:stringent starvation protein B